MNSNYLKKHLLYTTVLASLFAVATVTGCSKSVSHTALTGSSNARSVEKMSNAYPEASFAVDSYESNMEYEPAMETSSTHANTTQTDQKLIRTGSINLEVNSLATTRTAAEKWVKQFGGYISDSSEDSHTLTITAHIPSARFDDAMSASTQIGKITSKTVNSQDVTEQYYDLDTRLATKRILLERLNTYLKRATSVKDMLDIESRINDVTSDIESMQGQLNRLSKQIDYSQIAISAMLPVNHTEEGFILPDTKSQFRTFCGNILNFFSNFLFFILYVIIYGIPIVCVILLLYWLCLGKVGLLRNLFNKIRAPKKEKTTASKKK